MQAIVQISLFSYRNNEVLMLSGVCSLTNYNAIHGETIKTESPIFVGRRDDKNRVSYFRGQLLSFCFSLECNVLHKLQVRNLLSFWVDCLLGEWQTV